MGYRYFIGYLQNIHATQTKKKKSIQYWVQWEHQYGKLEYKM